MIYLLLALWFISGFSVFAYLSYKDSKIGLDVKLFDMLIAMPLLTAHGLASVVILLLISLDENDFVVIKSETIQKFFKRKGD